MQFITWILSFNERHYKDAQRYQKSGWFGRIFIIIILSAFNVGTLFVENWSLNVFNQTIVGGALAFVLFVGLFFGVLETNIIYAIFGFKMFVSGSLGSLAVRKLNKNKNRNENINENDIKEIKDYSKYRYFDLVIGIFFTLLTIAFVSVAIFFFASKFN